jgi:FMN reductase
MSVLLIAGSPSERSRTAALLEGAGTRLESRGVQVDRLKVRNLSPQALLLADFGHPSIIEAQKRVADASVLVIATPVYKAAYSGILKVFLDVLPQTALKGKTVLPLATGGSPHHMLALDYALRPVLQSLGAKHILPGIYATDGQVALLPEGGYQIEPEVGARLDEAVDTLIHETLSTTLSNAGRFSPIPFSQVRCSV